MAGGVFGRSGTSGLAESGGHFRMPGQFSAEANLTWYADPWTLTLGVKNIFGRTLYTINAESSFVPLRQGRQLLFNGSFQF